MVLDEAAFLSEAAASFDTAHPVCSQIFVVSSAGPSWMGTVIQNLFENYTIS
jgi:hypothetical protein